MSNVTFTRKSRNRKTGPIAVTMTTEDSCPSACPYKSNVCYAKHHWLGVAWRKLTAQPAKTYENMVAGVFKLPLGALWRGNQAGDLLHNNQVIDRAKLQELTEANKGKRGFTYTHHDISIPENREAIKEANANGFTINLSGNNLGHADTLASLGIGPVVVVLPHDATENTKTPEGRTVAICPAVKGTLPNCMACGLCAISTRKAIIAFPAHGSGKNSTQD